MDFKQTNLFDYFGGGETLAKQEPVKKDVPKKKAKQKTAKEQKEAIINLPVTICFGTFSKEIETINGKKDITISELRNYMVELGFLCFNNPALQIAYDKEPTENLLYARIESPLSSNFTVNHSVVVNFDENDTVTVSDGQLNCIINKEVFKGMDDDEITVEMIYQYFVEVNPQYKGCELISAPNCAVLLPHWGKSLLKDTDIVLPLNITDSTGKLLQIDNLDEKTIACAAKKICPQVTIKVKLALNQNKNSCFVLLSGGTPFTTNNKKKGSDFKKAVKKYSLPLQVYISTFNYTCELAKSDFPEKEKVTEQEVTDYFSLQFAVFKDNDRKPVYLYIPETNNLCISFVSGEKGAILETNLGKYVLENNKLTFTSYFPPVPISILEEIISYFRKDLSLESILRICYKKSENHFFLQYPHIVKASKVNIHYYFEPITNPDILTIAEFHSHNTMPAFFSDIDTKDECGIGIFGVIGKLNTLNVDVKVRIGYNGTFTSMENLFEKKE